MISFRRLLKKADLPLEIRFHDLRHTAGTLALRQGMPLHAVSKMLGHADPAMTLVYISPLEQKMGFLTPRFTPTGIPNEDL